VSTYPDDPPRTLLHEDLTRTILSCAFEVANELGAGFVESVYQRALQMALHSRGVAARGQYPTRVWFRGACVGEFHADLLVEDAVIVELKAVRAIAPEHHAQVINYLKAAGLPVGLLINFGQPRLEYRRFTRTRGGEGPRPEPVP
jgi:GxxExxY protein